MSLGDFYDYYNHATRRELWLSRTIPLWKGVKGPTLHLDFNINMAAVSLNFATVETPRAAGSQVLSLKPV